MSFLRQLWKELKSKKREEIVNKDIQFKSIYQGYITIPIQNCQTFLSDFASIISILNNITSMINKIVGYGGFKSYAEQPYSTIKQGKQLQLANQIWSSTKRQVDKIHPLDNYNHYHTIYKKNHLENTQPKDYHPDHVVRGAASSLNFAGNSLAKAYDAAQAQKSGEPGYRSGFNMLKTGVQHWKTNYQGSICQPAEFNKTFSQTQRNQANQRNASTGKLGKTLTAEQAARATSYKNRPYVNDCNIGQTEYRFNYGDKIGSKPTELLNHQSNRQPIRDNPLKHGTNQLWTEIPGYQGFKPSELHFQEFKSKIQQRKSIEKGGNKLQVVVNYQTEVPGYAGYKPKFHVPTDKLRDSCFQYKPK